MNQIYIDRRRPARGAIGTVIVCAIALVALPLFAQPSPSPAATQWPTVAERPKVKDGFTKAITRSATDKQFREDLVKFTDQATVKRRVEEELHKVAGAETMVIPAEIVIIFYIPQVTTASLRDREIPKAVKKFLAQDQVQNRNYHVFYLPTYDPQDTATHTYDTHIMCCYNPW